MTAFLVILIILVLLIIFLFLPITATVSISKNTDFKINYLGLKLFPLKEKQSTVKTGKADENKKNYFKTLIDKKGFSEALSEIFGIIKSVLAQVSFIFKHILIRNFYCKTVVASDDAAKTAIEYGAVCTLIYSFFGFLNSITDFKFKDIIVTSDFNSNKPEFELFTKIKIAPIYILIAGIKLLISFVISKRSVQ